MTIDLNLVQDIEVEDIHMWDAPDFCDAYISYATYDGVPMTDDQLNELNENTEFVHVQVELRLH